LVPEAIATSKLLLRRTLVPHNIDEHFCGTPLQAVVRWVILCSNASQQLYVQMFLNAASPVRFFTNRNKEQRCKMVRGDTNQGGGANQCLALQFADVCWSSHTCTKPNVGCSLSWSIKSFF